MSHFMKAIVLHLATVAAIIFDRSEKLLTDNKCAIILMNSSIKCEIPNQSDKGICVILPKCNAYLKVGNFSENLSPERLNFLHRVQCKSGNEGLEVCCPVNCSDYIQPEIGMANAIGIESANNKNVNSLKGQKSYLHKVENVTVMSAKIECGKQVTNRIYGGEIAELVEFPWMALIVYNSHEFGCGGALISNRHVLTAAHCVIGPVVDELKGLKFVRLGEFNTKTERDCIDEGNYLNCADIAKDVLVDKKIIHPDYKVFAKNKVNDIAVLRLRNTVTITQFIMPICLPEKYEENPIKPGQMFSVSGWGRTDLFKDYYPNIRSPIKLKLRVPIMEHNRCKEILKPHGFELAPTQICAGGEPSKDTCGGDSGGPLMYFDRKTSRWVTYGVVSYGFTECGLRNHPAVYTSVLDYVDWIVASMKK